MDGNKPNVTQERRVLEVLRAAAGNWVNGQYFLRQLYLSQYHRAIFNLQNNRERYDYIGDIEASDFTDENGFKSYRLITIAAQKFPSSSHPGVEYEVTNVDDQWVCTCPSFAYRYKCKHIDLAIATKSPAPKLL